MPPPRPSTCGYGSSRRCAVASQSWMLTPRRPRPRISLQLYYKNRCTAMATAMHCALARSAAVSCTSRICLLPRHSLILCHTLPSGSSARPYASPPNPTTCGTHTDALRHMHVCHAHVPAAPYNPGGPPCPVAVDSGFPRPRPAQLTAPRPPCRISAWLSSPPHA